MLKKSNVRTVGGTSKEIAREVVNESSLILLHLGWQGDFLQIGTDHGMTEIYFDFTELDYCNPANREYQDLAKHKITTALKRLCRKR